MIEVECDECGYMYTLESGIFFLAKAASRQRILVFIFVTTPLLLLARRSKRDLCKIFRRLLITSRAFLSLLMLLPYSPRP